VAQVARFEQRAEAAHVAVRVDQAGDERGALGVDDLGGGGFEGREVLAEGEDAAVFDGERGGRGGSLVDGVDPGVFHNQIC